MKLIGKCHCGNIKIIANINSDNVYACHCNDCQIMSGAPFRTMIGVDRNNVEISGDTKEYIKIAESGNKRIQSFCATCYTSLFSSSLEKERYSIRTGIFNERDKLKPKKHLYGKSSLKWIHQIVNDEWVTTMPNSKPYKIK